MKKISVIIMAVLLTLCGVRAMASLLSLTGMGSGDNVTIPTVSVKAGSTFTVPVSLENSNTGYVAFQMDIQLPQGVSPVYDDEGYILIEKSGRLTSSHDFSTTYDAMNNTIKLVCSSLRNSKIKDNSGELLYVVLKAGASMTSGDYQITCNNITFSTATTEDEPAMSYTLSDVTAIISVAGSEPVISTSWSIIFNENDVCEVGTIPGSFSDGDFILGVYDAIGKMSIDASNSRFGTIDDYTMFSYRLKTSGRSSTSQYLTLSIPQSGLLKIYARTANNSATDRNVVLTQDEKEIYNNVVSEEAAIEKIEINGVGEVDTVKIYPVIEVPVQTGIVEIGYPVGGINFYGFQMVANGSAETIEKVSVSSPISVKAGSTFTVPVSLENSNTGYVAFQMDIQLPQGVSPVYDEEGYILIEKSGRLTSSHDFSTTYDAMNNTIKLVCSSLRNSIIKDNFGELFYLNLQADASMTSGDYQITCNNITFSTATTEDEPAMSYTLSDATAIISVAGSEPVITEIDVPTALNIISKLATNEYTQDYYYVRGVITSISSIDTGSYGNATFYMASPNAPGQELMAYRVLGLNGEKITDPDLIHVGDEVVVYAQLQNYKGTTPETRSGGYLFSIVKKDKIVVPSSLSFYTGNSFSFPVSLENSNPNYVGFQMEILLPWGVRPMMDGEYAVIDASSRLDYSHTFTATYDEWSNSIKLVCSSMRNAKIMGTSGELFYLNLYADASMTAGNYQMTFNNVVFSTSSDAPEGAKSYALTDVSTILSLRASEPEDTDIDVPFALEIINRLATNTHTEHYYNVHGVITSISELDAGAYGNTTFYMAAPNDSSQVLMVYRALGLNGEKITDEHLIHVGDTVVVYAQLQNYKGIAETCQGGWLVEIHPYIDYPQSYYELNDAIGLAQNVLLHPALKAEGYNLLETAIATAQQALETVDDSTMIAAIVMLNDTKSLVLEKYMLPYETLNLRSIDGYTYYYYGTETFDGQNVTLTPMPENGSTPRLYSNYLRLYYSNKLVISSEDNIIKLVFDANRTLVGSFNTGEWIANNQWAGNANEVTLSVEAGSYKYYDISNLTVVYEAVDAETLLARLTAQIAAAENTLQSLAFANVPGASALDSLITVAKTATIETEASVIKSYINQLKSMIGAVVEMNQQYQALEALMQKVETAAQNNEGADATYVAEVTGKILEARAALNSGAYSIEDLWIITELMNSYLSELSKVYLSIRVQEPGTLATLIAEKGFEPNSVLGLIVSGSLNSDDMNTIKNMNNLEKIDMSETDVTEIPSQMFYYRSSLKTVVLPKNLLTIGYYAFYGCYSLTEITLPESLESIGYWAFGYCENLKSIICKVFTPIALYDYFMSEDYASQCMLYVPAIAVDAYRNAYFWQYFQIQGTDVMPENITVTTNLTIDWPANLDSDYKPNVRIAQGNNAGAYGALTLNGENMLSMNNFSMVWDPYNYYSQYNSETSRYEYYRYSHASLVANTPMRADKVNVELRTRTFRWDFISFPFDVKVSDITNLTQTNAPLVIRRYDGEKRANVQMGETWVDMDAESTLEAGKGYIWQSAEGDEGYNNNIFSVPALNNSNKNNIFTSNDVTVALNEYVSEFSQNRSWNLIGNPYPAFYDIRCMQTTAPITIWNGYNAVYEAYTPGDDNYILNPGQAFFIQRPIDQESITFLKEGRQTDLNVREEMNESAGRRAAANSERYVFNLILSGSEETQADRTRIVIDATAKMDYEAGRDASKFMSPEASAAQLFTTVGGLRYAINNRPLSDGMVELGLSIGTTGSYTIALSTKVEGEVYLIDRETGSEIRLDGTEGYTFQATKGTVEGRFAVRFGNGDLTGIKGVAVDGKDAGNWYNVNGQRVNAPAKGIYIQNGKKTVVK